MIGVVSHYRKTPIRYADYDWQLPVHTGVIRIRKISHGGKTPASHRQVCYFKGMRDFPRHTGYHFTYAAIRAADWYQR